MSTSSPAGPNDASAAEVENGSGSRPGLRRALRIAAKGLVGLSLLLGAGLLALQTETGATVTARFVASAANPFPGTEIQIDGASGSWLRSLQLTGVTLTRPDSTANAPVQMARIDTVSAQYRLLPLLRGRLHVNLLSVDGPSVAMRQAADSTWDWARVWPTSAEDDTSGTFPIQVDRARLSEGTFSAAFYAEGRDSTARVRDLRLHVRDLQTAPSLAVQVDTLDLEAALPNRAPDLRLAAQGGIDATAIRLDTLRLDSPRSRVRGHGHLQLPGVSPSSDEVAFQLRAAPLALRDLTPFLPTLDVDPDETVALDLSAEGTNRLLSAKADAQFSGGGTVSLDGTVTPFREAPPGDSLRYRLDADVRRLTTSLAGPLDSLRNRINGTATVDLRGASLEALNGTVAARLSDVHWTPVHVPEMRLSSTFQDGRAQLDLEGSLNDASVQATGTARPFDDAPSIQITARMQGVNVAAFVPGGGVDSDVSATVNVDGQGLGTPAMTLDATLGLDPSRIGTQQLDEGTVSLSVRPEGPDGGLGRRGRLDGSLALPAGQMRAVATARLNDEERFSLERLRLDSVDVASLAGDTTGSRVTGTVRATGQGFDPATMRLDAVVDLEASHYGPHRLSALTGTTRLRDGRLMAETEATLNGSEWSLSVRGQPFADLPTYEITDGRFRNLDVGPFVQDTTQSSQLTGTVRGRATLPPSAVMELEATVSLDSSRINQQQIDGGTLAAELRDERLTARMDAETPEGRVQLAGTARPLDDVPSYELEEGRFEALDVGALAGLPAVRTSLTGRLSLTGRGVTPDSLGLDAALALDASTINDASVSEGRLALTVAEGRTTANGRLAFDTGGAVSLQGHVDSLAATPLYDFRVEARSLDVAALAGRDSVTARIDTLQWALDGRGTGLDSLTARTTFFASDVQVDRFSARTVDLQGALRPGRLVVDTLGIASNVLTAQGSGVLGLTDTTAASNLTLTADVTNVQPLRDLVGAETLRLREGTVRAQVRGSAAEPQVEGTATLGGFAYNDLHLLEAEVRAAGTLGPDRALQNLEAEGTLNALSVPALSVDRTQVQATYDGRTVDLTTDVRLDETHTAALRAAVRPEAEQTEIVLEQADVRLGADRWALAEQATLTVGERYAVEGLRLSGSGQDLVVEGTVDRNGTQDLSAVFDNVRLDGISSLFGYPDLGGAVSGRMALSGPAPDPSLDGTLDADLRSGGEAVGTAELDVGYDSLAVALDATLTHVDGSVLTATGTVPADLRLRAPTTIDTEQRPVQIAVSTERFPVAWIDPFLDPATVRDPTGTLSADVTVAGTLNDPSLTGTASLQDGGVSLPDLGTSYGRIRASLRFSDDQATLTEAVIRSTNDGRLQADGSITFAQLTVGSFDLAVEASSFLAVDTRAYRRAVIDGSMQLRGTTQEPVLEGAVQVRSADVFYTEATAASESSVATVSLTAEDRFMLEDRFGVRLSDEEAEPFDFYEALAMDLTVRIQRDTWLRSRGTPEMSIQFTGDLTVSKAPNEKEQVFGTITVVEGRSTVRQFGQEFQITEGTLTFDGDSERPRLDLTAVFEQQARGSQEAEVRITLALQGRPDNLTPTLSSEPPMDTSNMLSYLATGRPARELLGGGDGDGGSGGALGTQALLGQASSFVENVAADELGLDVVRLEIRPTGTSYLTVGRYFTPRLFLSIGQPVGASSSDGQQSAAQVPNLTLEYQFTDTLLLRALNTQNALRLNLSFEYAY